MTAAGRPRFPALPQQSMAEPVGCRVEITAALFDLDAHRAGVRRPYRQTVVTAVADRVDEDEHVVGFTVDGGDYCEWSETATRTVRPLP